MFRVRLTLAVLALAATAAPLQAAGPVLRNFDLLAHFDEYSQGPLDFNYSACWSYIHSDGREYAVLGVSNGTAIYNVTNPAAVVRVGFIPGTTSVWREMKSYRDWIYVVTEGVGANPGLQIIRMTNPDAPVLAATWTGTFIRSHTVAIDTARALLICNGTRNSAGLATGMRFLSLANPEAPIEIGHWPPTPTPVPADEYVHDSVPIGNRLYASSIYSGIQRVFDITNPGMPAQIAAWTYPGAFTHNAWPDASGQYLYATDEVNGRPLRVFDIQNLAAPTLINGLTSNPSAIVHNAHVKGDELYLANYTEGIRALDLSDPAHPAEFAYADSWPGSSGGYFGVWAVCPYFPSGIVIASDIQTGLYVYRPRRDYGLARVVVQPSGGAAGLAGFKVVLDAVGDSLVTPDDGTVVFATDSGPHTITVKRFGYYDASRAFTAGVGSRDTIVVPMVARPVSNFAGLVSDAATSDPLQDAEVIIVDTPLHGHTDSLGYYQLVQVPDDIYRVDYRSPGYVPFSHVRRIGPGFDALSLALAPASLWEPMETDPGFTVGAPGDNATSGLWVRVEPVGTGLAPEGAAVAARATLQRALSDGRRTTSPFHEGHEEDGVLPGDIQPEFDRTPGTGTMCWVTGQGSLPGNIDESDVDGGRTSLTSRAFDLSAYADPMIGYWRWFYTSTPTDASDYLQVQISGNGGASWVTASTLTGAHAHWEEAAIRVSDFVTPTAGTRVRFVAADLGAPSIVEAAIDDLVLYEAGTPVTIAPNAGRASLRAPWPNPTRDAVHAAFAMAVAGPVEISVLDVAGRTVRVLHRGVLQAGAHGVTWDGRDQADRAAPAGLYFLRLRAAGEDLRARLVRVR